MNTLTKFGPVLGGYLLSCLAASGALCVYQLLTQDAASQAWSGMYAFGDLLLLLAVFGALALIKRKAT